MKYVCVGVCKKRPRTWVHTHTRMCVSKCSDSADPAASAQLPSLSLLPSPPLLLSSTPLLPLYGNARRSPSELLNLILSLREARGKKKKRKRGSNGPAEAGIVEFFISFTVNFQIIYETDCEDIRREKHMSICPSGTNTHTGTRMGTWCVEAPAVD